MEAPQSSFEVGGLDLSFMDKYKDEMQKGIEEIDQEDEDSEGEAMN